MHSHSTTCTITITATDVDGETVELGASSSNIYAVTMTNQHSALQDTFMFNHILQFLDTKSLAMCSSVNSFWDKACSSNRLWKSLYMTEHHQALMSFQQYHHLLKQLGQTDPKLVFELLAYRKKYDMKENRFFDRIEEGIQNLRIRNLSGRPEGKKKDLIRKLCSPFVQYTFCWFIFMSIVMAQFQLELGVIPFSVVLVPLYVMTLVWGARLWAIHVSITKMPYLIHFYDAKYFCYTWLRFFIEVCVYAIWIGTVISLSLYLSLGITNYGDLLQLLLTFLLLTHLISSFVFFVSNKGFSTRDQQFFLIECVLFLAYVVSWMAAVFDYGTAVYDADFDCISTFIQWGALMAMVDRNFWELLDIASPAFRIGFGIIFQILMPILIAVLFQATLNFSSRLSTYVIFIPLEVYLAFWGIYSTHLTLKSWQIPRIEDYICESSLESAVSEA